MSDINLEVAKTIEALAQKLEAERKTFEQITTEERKGNEARVRELNEEASRQGSEIADLQRKRRELEQRIAMQQERIEIIESLNDRPKGTIQDKIRDEHKSLFVEWMRKGGQAPEVDAKYQELVRKAREVKDITLASTAGGGFALPEQIASEIDALMLRKSEILMHVKNVRAGTSDYKELISIHGGTSGWVGEAGSRSATGTPNLRERAPTWGELYAYPQVSEWALQDIFFNVESWLTNDIADGMAVGLSTAIWSGNGSSKPTGMTNTTPVTTADYASPMRAAAAYQYVSLVSPASPSVVNADSVINLCYSLNPAYRSNAKFAMNTVTQGLVRRMKSTNGDYYWQPSYQAGQPDRLLGYEVFNWEDMGNGNTADAFAVAFGDFAKAYVLATRTELLVTRDQVTNPGYTRFYVRRRYGGCPLNNDALKFLRIGD